MYLGMDTSAYTTSAALVDGVSACLWEKRCLLKVPQGERGLAQSKSFFQHTSVLPDVLDEMPPEYWPLIKGIGVSAAPRPVRGSYMPVFRVGVSFGRVLARALHIPLVETSHQEGHLMAGLWSAGGPTEDRFLAFHISGGTTEILCARRQEDGRFAVEIIGRTQDLHAGQFIDRVGVSLGLPFPAGAHLARLAAGAAEADLRKDEGLAGAEALLPSAVKEGVVSFSGVESAAQRLIAQGAEPRVVARAVEGCCLRSFAKMIAYALEKTGLEDILMIGGVAANAFLRERLGARVPQARFFWAQGKWSSDNACGTALLARRLLGEE